MIYTLPSGIKVEFWFKHHNPASSSYVPPIKPVQPTSFEEAWKKRAIEDAMSFLEKNNYEVRSVDEAMRDFRPEESEALPYTEVHLTFKNMKRKSTHVAYATCAKGDTFRKETGRKIALRRLLDSLPVSLSYEDRKELWAIALPKRVVV